MSLVYDKFGDVILLATPNLKNNIQIMRICILKHNVSNSVSFTIKHLDFEILYCYFGHVSNKFIYHILDNVENAKKIHFPT